MSEDDGLIGAYQLDGQGGGREIAWAEMDALASKENLQWFHFDRNGVEVEPWLREKSGLRPLQVDALLADETRPRVVFIDNGILMTLRGVNLKPGANPEDMVSLRMWIEPTRIFTVRIRRLMAVNDVREKLEQNVGPKSTIDVLWMLAAGLLQRVNPVLEQINDEIDELENDMVENPNADIRHRLKDLRSGDISHLNAKRWRACTPKMWRGLIKSIAWRFAKLRIKVRALFRIWMPCANALRLFRMNSRTVLQSI